MPASKYIYNPLTLRFERSGISILRIAFTLFGLISFGFLFFVGLVFLQNYFIETPIEKALNAENGALKEYKIELAMQLLSAQDQIGRLEQKDQALYEKIFETKKAEGQPIAFAGSDKSMLLADGPSFHEHIESLQAKSNDMYIDASDRNILFGENAILNKKRRARMVSVPSFPPIAELDASKLVSGYGIRINPFHKGHYHHDGLDLAAARGSEVVAAAPGTVVDIVYSDLQAGFGNNIVIDHGDGYRTRYANLGDMLVHYGQAVTKGQPIGRIGISGGSVAPHLHYEVVKNGKNLNPVSFLMHGLDARQYELLLQASLQQNQSLD